jgi:Tol biopolymer transport system component
LVYISNRWAQRDIWTKDLATGVEANISRDSAEQRSPRLSPNGDQVAYLVEEQGKQAVYLRPFAGGAGQPVCEDCGTPRGWTPDGRYILYSREHGLYLLEAATGQTSLLAGAADAPVTDAALSTDGAWLAFRSTGNNSGLFAAPVGSRESVEPESWRLVVADADASRPAWSADGRTLYYTSSSTGSRDIWAIALDADKNAAGEPQLVRRFPNMRHSLDLMSLDDRQLSFGGGKLYFPMSELSGDIWLMAPR